MFYNSTSQNGRSNGQQLILLTGAIKSGKTSLIK
jgi:chloramphenicol 3-O-phosphotransferase